MQDAGVGARRAKGRGVQRVRSILIAIAYPALGFAALLAVWWAWILLAVEPGSFQAQFAPDKAFSALRRLIENGSLNRHVMASTKRIIVGLAIAAAIGIPFGLALGGIRPFARAAGLVTSFIRMISPLSWTPLAIIWFGIGDPPVYFLIAIGAVWPIALSTAAGVSSLDRQWLMLGRSLRASRLELLRTIIWPGIRGDVLTGLRLGLTTAWIILVPAEMLGVDSGMGYFILDSRDRFAYSELVAAIMVIGALGFVLDRLAQWFLTPRRRVRARGVTPAIQPLPETPVPATEYRI